ncbi:hypothetical protein TKK_0008007 [Trichogramma kaykai]
MNSEILEKLKDIKDEHCILVKFVNEHEEPIDIGFLPWIKNDIDKGRLTKIEENSEDIEVYWPNCNTTSARTLKNQLKSVDFLAEPVKILGSGCIFKNYTAWTEMKEKMENLKNYGSLSPTKGLRKNRSKKIDEDYVYDSKNKEKQTGTKTEKPRKIQEPKECKKTPELDDKYQENTEEIDYKDDEDDEDHEDDEDDEMVKTLEQKDEEIEKLQAQLKQSESKIVDLEIEMKIKTKRINSLKEELESEKLKIKFSQDDMNFIESSETKISKIIEEAQNVANNLRNLRKRNNQDDITIEQEFNKNKKYKVELSDIKKEELDPTNYTLTDKQKAGLPRDSIKSYAGVILGRLFLPAELSNSSLTGKLSNYSLAMNPNAVARPALSPNRLHAARNYTAELFPKTKDWKALFNSAAKNKLGR